MTFPAFDAVTVHSVLRGSGHLQVGASPPIPFSQSSVLIVPTSEQHWVGEVNDHAEVREAADRCAVLGGLIALLRDRWERRTELSGKATFHPRLSKALAAIIGNPAAPHTVDSLASLSGMSRASFSDHFSTTFGQGPIDFVQKTRLRIGARLLRTTDLPIKVTAQTAGYAGPRPFSRAFHAAYDCGPADYRGCPDGENIRA